MNRGYTLLETVIALTLWFILSAGIFFIWNFTSDRGLEIREQRLAFEDARLTMDALKTNFQLARSIELRTDSNDILQSVVMNQQNPQAQWQDYTFRFNVNAAPGTSQHHSIMFPLPGNEFASNIALVEIVYVNNTRMDIKITTGCEEPIVLEGSVCVRYKDVRVIGGS
jgi:type II secretory pathway pseudopilin PulG